MTLDDASALDAADPLAFARDRFDLPEGIIYLDGNSLGAMPCRAPERLREVAEEEWGKDLIASWNSHGWIEWPARIAAKLAPIVGAQPNELLIADSTSVSLFKLLTAALDARPGRRTMLTEELNFPTDLHIAQGVAALTGAVLRTVSRNELVGALDRDSAVLYLTHVDYRGGDRHDMTALNLAAHAAGALTLWDLSHSAGALDVDLAGSRCDLAVGCGYKFLNGGPGAPAFIFVAEHLQDQLRSPLQGWMGHADPFAFASDYIPAPGIGRFLTGTPSILALAALEAGLDTFAGVAMADVAAKSAKLCGLFIQEVERRTDIDLGAQRERSNRGSHVVVPHPHAYAVMQALIARGVIGDFRPPNLMRFGFAPLYTSFEDAYCAPHILGDVLATGEWDEPRFHARRAVT